MNKIIVVVLTIALVSCKTSDKEIDKLEIANKYYTFLDSSNESEMATILADSIVIRESEDDYEERFSKNGYLEWLQWESVFDPAYKILEITQVDEIVKAKISKIDKRISFLHKEPVVWNEIIRFDDTKIVRVERIEYEHFDVPKFLKNRDSLVSWIDKNHTELSGFLFPQTKAVGMKYLKAIETYEKEK